MSSYASLEGWNTNSDKESNDFLIKILNDKSIDKDIRIISLMLCLNNDCIGFSKVEEIMEELSLVEDIGDTYERLATIYKLSKK